MSGIQWRPEVNALTTPKSYRIRYVPRDVIGYEELAAEISATNPNYNEALVNSILHAFIDKVQEKLLEGIQVTLEEGFTFRLSFSGRLDEPSKSPPYVRVNGASISGSTTRTRIRVIMTDILDITPGA